MFRDKKLLGLRTTQFPINSLSNQGHSDTLHAHTCRYIEILSNEC